MTLARLLETGSGSLAARLVIEGLPIEFVSDPEMEKITPLDGRERVYCFNIFGEFTIGLSMEERVNIPEAKLEGGSTTISLFETEDERLSPVFWCKPDLERYVAQTVEVADTSITLLSADGIEPGDVLYLGTETLLVLSKVGSTINVTRGYRQSIAQKHWSNEPGFDIAHRKITNRPVRIRGRRVYLYLYGDADDLQGEGTLVWMGHVAGEPAVDDAGTVWRLQLANIAERLKGKLGGDLGEPVEPRGIYYPWTAPVRLWIRQGTTSVDLVLSGFFETREAFLDALNATIAADPTIAGFDHAFRAIPTADGGWTIELTVGTLSAGAQVEVYSRIDPEMNGVLSVGAATTTMLDGSGRRATSFSIGTALTVPRVDDKPVSVVRGFFGNGAPYTPNYGSNPANARTHKQARIYAHLTADTTSVQIEWPNGHTGLYQVEAVNESEGWFELPHHTSLGGDPPVEGMAYFDSALPKIRPLRSLGRGTLADLRAGLVAAGPEYCNRAGMPFITGVDLANWTAVVNDAASGKLWLQDRVYSLADTIDLEELLSHEMRLYGLFPTIEADGKIGVQSLQRVYTGGTPTRLDDEIISAGWSTAERGGQTVNMVTVRTGYDPHKDDWTGGTLTVRNMDSYALDHEDRPLEIEPRSAMALGDEFLDHADAANSLKTITDLFGFPHDFVSVNVPWSLFHLRLGDPVAFSADHLPDYRTGRRPTTDSRAIVVGRKWTLGEAHGTLALLVHGALGGGYAPTARILSQSNEEGDVWSLTTDPTMYAPSDGTPASFFEKSYAIRIIEYDSESPTVATGTVTAVSGNDITVELKETWAPGSATWELCFAPWDDCPEEQRQRFAYIADASGLLDGALAYEFAP